MKNPDAKLSGRILKSRSHRQEGADRDGQKQAALARDGRRTFSLRTLLRVRVANNDEFERIGGIFPERPESSRRLPLNGRHAARPVPYNLGCENAGERRGAIDHGAQPSRGSSIGTQRLRP